MQGSDFWQPCAPPKSCRNQKSFWDPSTYHPNTTRVGWFFFILKKHVLVGHPTPRRSWLLMLEWGMDWIKFRWIVIWIRSVKKVNGLEVVVPQPKNLRKHLVCSKFVFQGTIEAPRRTLWATHIYAPPKFYDCTIIRLATGSTLSTIGR